MQQVSYLHEEICYISQFAWIKSTTDQNHIKNWTHNHRENKIKAPGTTKYINISIQICLSKYIQKTLTSSDFNAWKCFAMSILVLMFSSSSVRFLSLANCVSVFIFLDTSELWGLYFDAIRKAAKAYITITYIKTRT